MAKIEQYICDINGCKEEAAHRNTKLQVIFTTEQTEGRSTKPYLDSKPIDICEKHWDKLLSEKKYIVAYGAQGNNTFNL